MSGRFDDLYWTLLQVLAWVFLRDPELVARCGTDVHEDRRHAEEVVLPQDGRPTKVLVEMPGRPPSTLMIALVAAQRGATETAFPGSPDQVRGGSGAGIEQKAEPPLPQGFSSAVPPTSSAKFKFETMETAEDEIAGRFRRGELGVIGRFMGRDARVQIPADQLLDAQIDWDRSCIFGKAPPRLWMGPPRWWSDVLIERLVVLRLWPPDMEPPRTVVSAVSESPPTTKTTAPTPTVRPQSEAVREMLAKYDELVEANQDFASKMARAQHKQILTALKITDARLPAGYSYTTYRRAVRVERRDGKAFRRKKSSGC
jgi:hypothetical protein